jgi:hypothetical protein
MNIPVLETDAHALLTGVQDDADSGRDPGIVAAGRRPPGTEEDGGQESHGRQNRHDHQHRWPQGGTAPPPRRHGDEWGLFFFRSIDHPAACAANDVAA